MLNFLDPKFQTAFFRLRQERLFYFTFTFEFLNVEWEIHVYLLYQIPFISKINSHQAKFQHGKESVYSRRIFLLFHSNKLKISLRIHQTENFVWCFKGTASACLTCESLNGVCWLLLWVVLTLFSLQRNSINVW